MFRELFHHLKFDIMTRVALGLHDLSMDHYAQSTLFLFQQRLEEFDKEYDRKPMKELLDSLNAENIERLGLSVETIRLDSTFLDSNRTNFNRIFRYNSQKPQKTGELYANELLFLILHLLKTVFQLSTGFKSIKIRKFCCFRPLSYNVPNLREILN